MAFKKLSKAEKQKRQKVAAKQAVTAKAAEASFKAVESSTYTELASTAKEINAVLDMATRADQQADDRRLTAALALEKARKLCEKRKVNFKKWCEREVKQSYETVRKLVAVGSSTNPKQALADMRHKNKKANKKLREKRNLIIAGKTPPEDKPYVRAEKALNQMKDKDQHTFIDSKAKKLGFRVITNDEMKVLAQVQRGNVSTPNVAPIKGAVDLVKAAQAAFEAIPKAGQQLEFVKWAVAKVGGKFSDGWNQGDDGMDIPPALDRCAKVTAGKAA